MKLSFIFYFIFVFIFYYQFNVEENRKIFMYAGGLGENVDEAHI